MTNQSFGKQHDSRLISSDPEIQISLQNDKKKFPTELYFNERRLQTAPSLKYSIHNGEERRCSMIGGIRVEKDSGGFTIAGFFFSKYFSIIMLIMGSLFLSIGGILIWICYVPEGGNSKSGGNRSVEQTEISKENKIIGPICMLIGAGIIFVGGFFGFVSWKIYRCDTRKTNYVLGNKKFGIFGKETTSESINLTSIKSSAQDIEIGPLQFNEKSTAINELGCSTASRTVIKTELIVVNNLVKKQRNNSLPLLNGIGGKKVGCQTSSWFNDEETKEKEGIFSAFRQDLIQKYKRKESLKRTNSREDNIVFFASADANESYYDNSSRRRSDIACFPKKELTDECTEHQEVNILPSPKKELLIQEINPRKKYIEEMNECQTASTCSTQNNLFIAQNSVDDKSEIIESKS
ncbi:uncharacterized protein [Lepeophtheirus salmonis]|uniref:Putative LOC100142275 [Tribolium castaneum] n=1 Tax=Lepeophtheirus salmonis TaxID=72036 RepID=A0A0K2UMH3_LEPSM|nr:uncharacterized protein LOC121114660 [Lepeophtheirus salmonis]